MKMMSSRNNNDTNTNTNTTYNNNTNNNNNKYNAIGVQEFWGDMSRFRDGYFCPPPDTLGNLT